MPNDPAYYVYNQLLLQIAAEDNRLSGPMIGFIRHRHFADNLDRRGIAEYIVIHMRLPKKKRKHPVSYYQKLLNFVASCSQEEWGQFCLSSRLSGGCVGIKKEAS